jgi:hypothetical protein
MNARYRIPTAPALHHPVLSKAVQILTPRDRWLIDALHLHRVLTTEQLMQLFFRNLTTTRHRLLRLEQHGLLTRFRPWRPVGTAPAHWSLDVAGLLVYDASHPRRRPPGKDDTESPEALLRRMRSQRLSLDALAHSTHLAHRVETTSFFTRLIWDARTHHDGRVLARWWNERQLGNELGSYQLNHVRPDGYGAWQQDAKLIEFFLEYDRGTEPLHRLRDKIAGYPPLIGWVGRPMVVLIVLPSPRRLANAKTELWPAAAAAGLPIALGVTGTQPASGVRWTTPSQPTPQPLNQAATAVIADETT